ncbi:Hypothetical predicted protein [Mytilus galloprovincialis]|uniref:Uncharacterized protein n=1 Tax=Mytilus galloprovincialis TaxID=29158 RepID=A0A8B6C3J3_MYTGA|nr:Hypothetical predicted protein [Mytilus galloprovincialis]
MAGRIFNIFRKRPSRYIAATQTLAACQKTFTNGVGEISLANGNLKTFYDNFSDLLRFNQVKLQLAEELVNKLYDEMSSLGGVAVKLRQQIERDEKHLEERKKLVSVIQNEIQQLRNNLNTMKEEHGFNEWIAKNKEDNSSLENYQADRVAVEMDIFRCLQKIQQLSGAHDETDNETIILQDLRENYNEVHEDDIKALSAQLDMVRQKRKLFSVQPIEKAREIVFLFSSKTAELELNQQELLQTRTLVKLRQDQIIALKEEHGALGEHNDELMYRLMEDKDELNKLKNETDKSQPLEYNLPSGEKIKRWVVNK